MSTVEYYLDMIDSLSTNEKIELIEGIAKSIKSNKKLQKSEKSIDKLFGAFESEKSADEIIKELRDERCFNIVE